MEQNDVQREEIIKILKQGTPETPSPPETPITVAVVGAGQRGKGYAQYALNYPNWLKVVAVAEPNEIRRQLMVKTYDIPEENVFSDWKEMANQPRLADAVMVCTLDHAHTEPAIAFADLQYHILLEKPMAVTIEDCRRISEAAIRNQVIFAVAHVLRYTPHNRVIKRFLDSGLLGDIVNIQHTEPVGFWHFAHSYVRGNWRNEKEASFSLMTKSCHDIDIVQHWMGSPCVRISSFGNLWHFNKRNKPKEAGDAKRCLDCAYEETCPYSAKKIYLTPAENGVRSWPVSVLVDVVDIESVTGALRNGPYGRCVYESDNDVVDHQVVNMEFANGTSASFTMIAYTEAICARKTRIFGTRGELECDGEDEIQYFDFLSKRRHTFSPSKLMNVWDLRGHGGGDFGLMEAFVHAIAAKDTPTKFVASDAQETFNSHLYVFAAEHARKTGKVVDVDNFKSEFVIDTEISK